jgi:hypothetical protein
MNLEDIKRNKLGTERQTSMISLIHVKYKNTELGEAESRMVVTSSWDEAELGLGEMSN